MYRRHTLQCEDGNPCTTDSCESGVGCLSVANEAPCDDENACTVGEQCSEGSCGDGAAVVCDDNSPCTTETCVVDLGCVIANSEGQCDDGDPCTENDTCLTGTCIGGFPVSCDDGNACTAESCVEGIGCVTSPISGACDDLNACTLGDTCASGSCLGNHPCGLFRWRLVHG